MFLALKGLPLVLVSIVAFIIIIGLIICIHELGHFFFARKAGILCHEFSFGMGPALYKKKVGETTFCIRAIPIGGYVSMAGEEATDSYYKPGLNVGLNLEGEVVKEIILDENKEADIRGTIKTADLSGKDGGPLYITLDLGIQDHYFPVKNDAIYVFENNQTLQIEPYDRTFDSKTIWQRFITLFAGPMNNFILAIIIYLIASFATGVPNYKSNKVGSISGEAYPAYGVLQKGDILTKVNGNNVSSWSEFSKEADKAYETSTTIYITFTRAGVEKTESLEAISIIQSVGISNLGAAKLTPITSADGYKYKDSSTKINFNEIESAKLTFAVGEAAWVVTNQYLTENDPTYVSDKKANLNITNLADAQTVAQQVGNGTFDVGFLPLEYANLYKDSYGVELIAAAGDLIPEYVCCRQATSKEKYEAFVAYEKARIRAWEFIENESNRDEVVNIVANYIHKEKDYVSNYLYGGITKWSVDPNKKGITTYKNALYNAGVLKQDISNIESYVELGAYETAIKYLADNNKSNTFYQAKLQLFNEYNK